MDFWIIVMLIGIACFILGILYFRHSIKKMKSEPSHKPNDDGCIGTFFIWLMIIGAIMIILAMFVHSGGGAGDPSYAPNWRGR